MLKVNRLGIFACILVFIAPALPWWTMTTLITGFLGETMTELSVYLYEARMSTSSNMGQTITILASMNLWYGRVALVLIVIGGVLGIIGSITAGKRGKIFLSGSGTFMLLSIIIFAVGLQNELATLPQGTAGLPPSISSASLFSSDSSTFMGFSINYQTYLTFGFWITLIATMLEFIAVFKHPAPPAASTMQTQKMQSYANKSLQ